MTSVFLPFLLLLYVFVPRATGTGFDDARFQFFHEFYGPQAYSDPAASDNFANTMANGFTLWPPVDDQLTDFVSSRGAGMILALAGATKVNGNSANYIESQRRALARLCGTVGAAKTGWNLMTEWDQAGGRWVPDGRPKYSRLSRQEAYRRFVDYYVNNSPPLGMYLRQTRDQRGCALIAQTDYPANVSYAYEMGVDVALLERGIDELSDLSTGLAFIRGSARQYDRRWGIDLSSWRTSNNSPTQFTSEGVLTGGWSPSYLRRHLYISYLSGAHMIQMEPSTYRYREGGLNPLGQVIREFGDFALTRHPDVGRPAVSTALLVDFFHGFDPKHGVFNQSDAVWYQDIPYSDGDHMVNNFLRVAFPNHWLHGLTPGAPFLDRSGTPDPIKFQQYLTNGSDPRPYEPMGSTRWGDNLDVISSKVSPATLAAYKVVILLGDVVIDERLRTVLHEWVEDGGTLVANVQQITSADDKLVGALVGDSVKTATTSTWVADGATFNEGPFQYKPLVLGTAKVLAKTESDPLVTANTLGQGEVVLTTPRYLQTLARDQLLAIGTRLFDSLQRRHALVQIAGPPVEYIINRAPDRVMVTVVNNGGTAWTGTIELTLRNSSGVTAVREYIGDTSAAFSTAGGTVVVPAEVPPYDIRVYAFHFA